MEPQRRENIFKNLKWYEHAAAGWTVILVFIGGAIGGILAGVAYFFNVKVLDSKIPNAKKYTFIFLIGIAAIATYLIVAVLLVVAFPGLFKK